MTAVAVLAPPPAVVDLPVLVRCAVCLGWFLPSELASDECTRCTWADERAWKRRNP